MNLLPVRFVVAAVICALVPQLAAEDIRGDIADRAVQIVDATVRQQMEQQKLVGVAVGILRDGKLIYTKGYGLADMEDSVPVTSETVFNWASNSKPVVALIAMQLVQAGRLDLDADIRNYVPEYPAKKSPITTRQLLSHQSGIAHYTNGPLIAAEGYAPGDHDHDPVVAIGRFSESPLIFEPGEKYSYSSYAYVLLSAVVQAAAKQSFEDLVAEQIVEPLQLKSFQWDVATNKQPHWSKGYYRGPFNIVIPVPEQAHYWKHGAGGFKSSIVDFGRWAEAVLNRKLMNDATWNEMLTIPQPRDGSSSHMALGINVEGQGQALKLSHGGSQGESRSRLVVYPNQGHGIVVLSNSGHADTGAITTAIYAALEATPDSAVRNSTTR